MPTAQAKPITPTRLLSEIEAAEIVGVHPRTMAIYAKAGQVVFTPLGRSRRYRQEALEEFLRRGTTMTRSTLAAG